MKPSTLYKTRTIRRSDIERAREVEKVGSGFDVVKTLNRTLPKGVELHLWDEGADGVFRQSSFTGPNTNLDRRLGGFDRKTGTYSSVNTPPINELDAAAMAHDIAYSMSKDLDSRHKADRKLIEVANRIISDPSTSPAKKRSATIVKILLSAKVMFGFGFGFQRGGSYDVNELISMAKTESMTPGFQGQGNDWIYPLLGIALSVGMPAFIKMLSKKNK
jgi:hypothetical protein